MTTLLFSHPDCLLHDMGAGHPERPDRLRAVLRRLERDYPALVRRDAPLVERADALRAHPATYIDMLQDIRPAPGATVRLDPDTAMNAGSWTAACRAAGGAVAAVDAVLSGEADNAFVATRPPGHHAEQGRAMGFCFLNNAVIAARHAQAVHGLKRVAIVDFDVHHGNGAQDILWDDPTVLYASTHEMPLFPGSGAAQECGAHDTIINAPLPPGADGAQFRAVMDGRVLPRVDAFAPELLIVSAGFDGHTRDPLASMDLVEDDFAWITQRLAELAARHAGGRLVSLLEGGYDLEGLAGSASAHVAVLMDQTWTGRHDPQAAGGSIGSVPAISMPKPDSPT